MSKIVNVLSPSIHQARRKARRPSRAPPLVVAGRIDRSAVMARAWRMFDATPGKTFAASLRDAWAAARAVRDQRLAA